MQFSTWLRDYGVNREGFYTPQARIVACCNSLQQNRWMLFRLYSYAKYQSFIDSQTQPHEAGRDMVLFLSLNDEPYKPLFFEDLTEIEKELKRHAVLNITLNLWEPFPGYTPVLEDEWGFNKHKI